MSLAKLTSQSTQTLSLLLERQRLNNLSPSSSNLHLPQIARNLALLRSGILNLDTTAKSDSEKEGARLLRSQYERMRMMLPEDVQADLGIEKFVRAEQWSVCFDTDTMLLS
jgi:syntaxin 8